MSDVTHLETRVIDIVADALCVERDGVQLHSSLIDDLGAESIDFLDLQFRLESDFGIKIPDDEMWRGTIDPASATDPVALDRALDRLKTRMPQFRWDALPTRLKKGDLPRLITVQTVVDYLQQRAQVDPPVTE